MMPGGDQAFPMALGERCIEPAQLLRPGLVAQITVQHDQLPWAAEFLLARHVAGKGGEEAQATGIGPVVIAGHGETADKAAEMRFVAGHQALTCGDGVGQITSFDQGGLLPVRLRTDGLADEGGAFDIAIARVANDEKGLAGGVDRKRQKQAGECEQATHGV